MDNGGERELVRRMLGNLIDNAVRHAPPGTTVHVALAHSEGKYVVTVRDSGGGIPEEQRVRIFERFHRAESPGAPDDGAGAGLGLALARWIARTHGGDLDLTDTSSAGSTFTVWLPLSR